MSVRSAHAIAAAFLFMPLAAYAQSATSVDRIPPRPIRPPASFASAVANGTRTEDGRPGQSYWGQRVDYRIEATLDVATGRLRGSETVTYRNNSPSSLTQLLFHLEQNVYATGVVRNRSVSLTGGMSLARVTVSGQQVETAPYMEQSRYYSQPTLLVIPLADPVPPGETVEIGIDWTHIIPAAPTYRGGNLDNQVFAVAQ